MKNLDSIPEEVKQLARLGSSDFRAFLEGFNAKERILAGSLTGHFNHIHLFDSCVWELCYSGAKKKFGIRRLGLERDLVIHVNPELTGINDPSNLHDFTSILRRDLPGFEVILGDWSGGKCSADWVVENHYVKRAWSRSVEEILTRTD